MQFLEKGGRMRESLAAANVISHERHMIINEQPLLNHSKLNSPLTPLLSPLVGFITLSKNGLRGSNRITKLKEVPMKLCHQSYLSYLALGRSKYLFNKLRLQL